VFKLYRLSYEFILPCDLPGKVWCKCIGMWSKWLWKEFTVPDTWWGKQHSNICYVSAFDASASSAFIVKSGTEVILLVLFMLLGRTLKKSKAVSFQVGFG